MKTAPKASWGQRVGATLIDGLILSAVALVVGLALAAGGADSGDATIGIYVMVFLASVVYSPLLMAREGDANGQTIGKGVIGIRVVHEDGHPMTVGRGLVRDGVGKALLGLIPLYTFIDVLWPLPDGDNQAHPRQGRLDLRRRRPPGSRRDLPGRRGRPRRLQPAAAAGAARRGRPSTAGAARAPCRAAPPCACGPGRPARGTAATSRGPTDPGEPDFGGFRPPAPPPPPPPASDGDGEGARGPFGPSYD